MKNTLPILVGLASAVAAMAAGVVSNLIFKRQRGLAMELEHMAGIERIEETKGKQPLTSLSQALKKNEPYTSLRILAISGASIFKNEPTVKNLLGRGVDIDIMLLDPESNNWLFKQHPWLQDETRETLNLLKDLARSLNDQSGKLSIRLYPQPLLELLMFIDNKHLFLSSYFPIASTTRLIYQIRQGEQSLFKLYDEALRFLWDTSYINQPIDTD